MEKTQNNYSNLEMFQFIFRIETEKEYSQEVIDEYEAKYKVDLFEAFAEYVEENYKPEDQEDIETSVIGYYNPDNLVHWFKSNESTEQNLGSILSKLKLKNNYG